MNTIIKKISFLVIATLVLVLLLYATGSWQKEEKRVEEVMSTYSTTTPADVSGVASTSLKNGTSSAENSVTANKEININKNLKKMITLETNKGNITIELFEKDAPKTAQNFLTLVNKGFYNGLIFHRVISGFMIQGGDPTGTGMGGPGYKFADELNPNTDSYKAGYVRGTVAMANSGPNTNGSQFFIMHRDTPLPHNYSIFGMVVSGIEVVDAIADSQTDRNDRPISEVVIKKASVVK